MTALALALAFLGLLAFASFAMWMRAGVAPVSAATLGAENLYNDLDSRERKLDSRLRTLESRPVFTPEMAKQLDAFVTARALDALRSRPAKEPQG